MGGARSRRRGPSHQPATDKDSARGAARRELVALHRAIYERQKAEIDASVQGYSAAFRAYERSYRRRVRRYRRRISYDEVIRRAAAADLVYVGDYHTLKQAQKAFTKLVERSLGHGRPAALALEFVQSAHQVHLDRYLAGRIREATFLRRIEYPAHHIFPVWPAFKPIFELARLLGLPVFGIDLAGEGATLSRRDRHAAALLAELWRQQPERQIFVLTGQLHVAPPHLPDAVDRAARRLGLPPPRRLVVYQNCEDIFWRLTAEGLEHETEAVEVSDEELSLMNTSPIVAQQSYLNHLHADDTLEIDPETVPERTFKEMCRVLCAFLELDPKDALEQVTVYSLGDLSFFHDLRRSGAFSKHEIAFMRRQILASESYFIPRMRLVYLANLSINHAAEEAAHFLRHVFTEDDGDRDGLVDAFYARVLNEALAFLGSKIINPRRKAPHRPRLERWVEAWRAGQRQRLEALEVRAAELVLAHLDLEAGRRVPGLRDALYGASDAELFNAVTHMLGYILGDRLYYAMISGKATKAEIRELFLDPLDEEGAAFHMYFYWAERVRRVRIPRGG